MSSVTEIVVVAAIAVVDSSYVVLLWCIQSSWPPCSTSTCIKQQLARASRYFTARCQRGHDSGSISVSCISLVCSFTHPALLVHLSRVLCLTFTPTYALQHCHSRLSCRLLCLHRCPALALQRSVCRPVARGPATIATMSTKPERTSVGSAHLLDPTHTPSVAPPAAPA